MELNAIQVIGLILLILIIPAYQTMRGWRQHRLRQAMADAHHWRYAISGWQAILKPAYSMAGTTPSGLLWVLKREMRERHWFFVWRCRGMPLPYGVLRIYPRRKPALSERDGQQQLRPVEIGSQEWKDAYALVATHDVLAERFVGREVEQALLDWPAWPSSGALEEIVWNPEQLAVRVRYQTDLHILHLIVNLGTTLVENAARTRVAMAANSR